MTKKVLILSLCILVAGCWKVFSQSDMILCLDGSTLKGIVTQITDEQIQYIVGGIENTLDRRDVYMIKFERRGNMFFLQNGKLSFDDGDGKVPADAVTIYMVWGQELTAQQADVKGLEVVYDTYDKKNRQHHAQPKKDVFMVRYPNGTYTIVTPIRGIKADVPSLSKEQQLPVVLPIDASHLKKLRPAEAVILLQNSNTINAIIIGGNEQVVTYYRKEAPKGPVYQLQRSKIESIEYKNSKKTKIKR